MRKAYLLIAATLLLALLVACAPMEAEEKEAAPEKEETKEPIEKETVDEKVIEPKKETAPKETAPAPKEPETKVTAPKDLPEAIKSKIDAANTKLKSMVYLYASPENQGRFLDTYHVLGDKVKVKLYEDNEYVEAEYFDTVYLDTTKKTATGRCENKRRCMSSRVDNTGKVFDANYDDYRRKTPYEWLSDITTAEVVGPEIVDRRSVLKISYPKGETTVEMWLDNTYGIPLQLKVIYPNEEENMYQYSNFQFNTLKEEDVTPAFIEPLDTDEGNQTD